MRFVYYCIFCITTVNSVAIGLADFVPNFLVNPDNANNTNTASSEGKIIANHDNAVSSGVIAIQGADVTPSAYCKRNGVTSKSVFCTVSPESTAPNPTNDNQAIPSNGYSPSAAGNLNRLTPNQTALQSQGLRTAMGKYSSNYMLSMHPKENLNIGMGVTEKGFNELQLNIKY